METNKTILPNINNKDFDLSELSSELLLACFRYYTANHFWKYDFDEWILNVLTPVRNNEGKLIDLYREYKKTFYIETDMMLHTFGSHCGGSHIFAKLYKNALERENE